ncbi:hypothetical protein [uncultured Paludibaculum sp.]|uniref:hypothetical protein n=1 Tax=uncultured Paludibaculum sp. TaxID=1765020 RepID=UPI002AAAC150|nr:hypothetical protein [uncultured Paludibaculum sp.]
MLQRARKWQLAIDYTDTPLGFWRFVADIGLVPDGIVKPSVGRKDHALGYIAGNFEWQELSENDRESAYRVKPWEYVTEDSHHKRAASNTGQKRTEEQRARMSAWQKGKTLTEAHKQALRDAHQRRRTEKDYRQ